MSTRTILRLAAAVSLLALAGCQQGPMSDAQRAFILSGGFSRQSVPTPPMATFYPMVIPQSHTFNCYGCY